MTKSYQELNRELDEVLSTLQGSDLDIDEAIKLYEKGVSLTSELENYIKQAENKVTKLKASFDS